MKSTRRVPRIGFLSHPIPRLQPYLQRGQRALPPLPPLLRRPPMAWPAPKVLPGGFRPSSQPLRICRARPNVWPAGSRGGRQHLDHKFLSPLRPGRPPGYRRKPIHEVDEVLIECDDLAWEAMKPDTI